MNFVVRFLFVFWIWIKPHFYYCLSYMGGRNWGRNCRKIGWLWILYVCVQDLVFLSFYVTISFHLFFQFSELITGNDLIAGFCGFQIECSRSMADASGDTLDNAICFKQIFLSFNCWIKQVAINEIRILNSTNEQIVF